MDALYTAGAVLCAILGMLCGLGELVLSLRPQKLEAGILALAGTAFLVAAGALLIIQQS